MSAGSPERFRRIRELFLGARDLDRTARAAYLAEHCGQDGELAREVESLLREHDSATPDFEEAVSDAVAEAAAFATPDPASSTTAPLASGGALPERIGTYRILRRIGAGGMGTVFEAEQESPRRKVALKVLRAEFASSALLRRFRQESEILGRLQHPAIAKIYEAATFDADRPYFAMELIDGISLTAYAREEKLGHRQRLELVAEIADAIQYAHDNGVVHRDLKPSNVLVDRAGRPHILDFGIARADSLDTTLATGTGQLLGTLPYMSPEQVSGDPTRVDFRCDIYALGVLAYELLTDRLPLDVRDCPVPEATLIIREQDPDALSTSSREFRGDLETIVMTALAKEPERRYPSAAELAADIRRFLSDLAISARPPSAVYQARKFIRRNRILVGSAATIFVILITATIGMSIALARALEAEAVAHEQKLDADDARERAEEEAAIAEAVNDFLNDDLLASVDPGRTKNPDITMREVLDIAAEKIEGRFSDTPSVGARIHRTLGLTYQRLGLLDKAEKHWRAAFEIVERDEATDNDVFLTGNSLSTLYLERGEIAKAETLLRELIERHEASGDAPIDSLLQLKSNLCGAMLRSARFEEAVPLLVENLEGKQAHFGDEHASTLTTMNNLAGAYLEMNRLDDAIEMYRSVEAGRRAMFGDEDLRTLSVINNLSWALVGAGQAEEAVRRARDAAAIIEERIDHDHPLRATLLATQANALRQLDRLQEASDLLFEIVRIRTEKLGPQSGITIISKGDLAFVLVKLGRLEECEEIIVRALRDSRRVFPARHWARGFLDLVYGMCLHGQDRLEEAEETLLRAYQILVIDHEFRRHFEAATQQLAFLYDDMGRPEEADEWREKLDAILAEQAAGASTASGQ